MGTPLSDARARLLAGDGAGASVALDPIDLPGRLVATLALSREASAAGLGPDVQDPLFAALDTRAPTDPKARAPGDAVDHALFRAWHAASDAFPIERIALVLRLSGGKAAAIAPDAVRAELARGRLDEARVLAELVPKAKKALHAETQARLAVHGPEKQRDKALAKLVKGVTAKKVADGGEESDALGAILEVMAGAGLPASDPTVEAIRAGLLQLSDEPTRRQQTDWGVLRAVRACAGRKDDPAWRALGEQLEKYGLQHPISQREARRIWADARGEPPPPPVAPASSSPTPRSIAEQAVALLLAGDAARATEALKAKPSLAETVGREAAQLLLDTGHEREAVTWCSSFHGAFEILGPGIRDPKSLEALEAVLPTMKPGTFRWSVSPLARAAARLGVMDAWRDRLLVHADALSDAGARSWAYTVLVAASPPSVAVDLVERWLASRAP